VSRKVPEDFQRGLRSTLRAEVPVPAPRRVFLARPTDDYPCVYPVSEDEVVATSVKVAGGKGRNVVFRYNLSTGRELWAKETPGYPWAVDYDDESGYLLVSSHQVAEFGLLILDARDGSIIRRIDKVGDIDLKGYGVFGANFDPDDPDTIFFTVYRRHVAVRYNLVTGSYKVFGELDIPGRDNAHLNSPVGLSVNIAADEVLIADYDNHRVLLLDKDLANVKGQMLLPYPWSIWRTRWGLKGNPYYLTFVSTTPNPPTPPYLFAYTRQRRLKFSIQMASDEMRLGPDLRSLWVTEVFGYLYHLPSLMERFFRHPGTALLLNAKTVSTSGYRSPPLPAFLWGSRCMVRITSTQSGTFRVLVPKELTHTPALGALPCSVPGDFDIMNDWDVWDEKSMPSGTNHYVFDPVPPPLFKLEFVPSAEATVTMNAHFWP